MTAEDLLIHNGCNRQTIKAVCEGLPELNIKPPLTFIIESIDPVDASALMISS